MQKLSLSPKQTGSQIQLYNIKRADFSIITFISKAAGSVYFCKQSAGSLTHLLQAQTLAETVETILVITFQQHDLISILRSQKVSWKSN